MATSDGQAGASTAFQAGWGAAGNDKQDAQAKSTIKKAAKPANLQTQQSTTTALIPETPLQNFKRGGRVKKTGLALLHRGEYVVPTGKHRSAKKTSGKTVIKA